MRDSDAVKCVWRLSAHAVAQRDGLAMIVLNAHLLVPLDDWSSRGKSQAHIRRVSEWQSCHHYPAMDFDEAVECIRPPATRELTAMTLDPHLNAKRILTALRRLVGEQTGPGKELSVAVTAEAAIATGKALIAKGEAVHRGARALQPRSEQG